MRDQTTPFLTDPAGHEHYLDGALTTLGRAQECDIVIVSKQASREHAHIRREGRKVFLEDAGSTNGTFLNGERIQSAQLHDGDQLGVAGILFTFHDPDVTVRETALPELELDLESGEVRVNRRLVSLSPKEYVLLSYLYRQRGRLCSKDEIGRAVWSEYETGIFDYQIENLVRRLRMRIETDPNAPQLLLTVRGLGYKLASAP